MARVTPQQAAEKWKTRLSGATTEIKNGVMAVSVAPGVKAAAAKQQYLARVNAAADKWARNVSAVSLQQWQAKMVDVGIGRIATGAQANQGKMEAFMAEFLPYMDNVSARVKAMPNNSLEDSIARMAETVRSAAKFSRGAGSAQRGV